MLNSRCHDAKLQMNERSHWKWRYGPEASEYHLQDGILPEFQDGSLSHEPYPHQRRYQQYPQGQ